MAGIVVVMQLTVMRKKAINIRETEEAGVCGGGKTGGGKVKAMWR